MRRAYRDDSGAAKTSTMAVWLVVLVIVALFGIDTFTAVQNRVHTENDAQEAALAASTAYHANSNNLQAAYLAAVQALAGKNETVATAGFSVDASGGIHLTITHTAKTLVLSRIGPLKHYATTTQDGDANSISAG
jgi:Flp pilus assembly protein TadG